MTRTAPFLRMTLHFSHIGMTDARTFIAPVSTRIQDPRSPHESDGRVRQWPTGPTEKDSRDGTSAASASAGPTWQDWAHAKTTCPGYLLRRRRLRRGDAVR